MKKIPMMMMAIKIMIMMMIILMMIMKITTQKINKYHDFVSKSTNFSYYLVNKGPTNLGIQPMPI